MATLGFIILENQKLVLSEQIDNMAGAITSQFANSAAEMVLSDDSLGLQTLISNLVENKDIKGAIVVSDKNKILVTSGIIPDFSLLNINISELDNSNFEWSNGSSQKAKFISFSSDIKFNKLIAGYVLVTFSRQRMVQSLNKSRYVISMVTILMTLLAVLIAFVMSRHLSKPIHNLVDASIAIGKGDYQYRLSEKRNDEIGELAIAFNKMAQGLLKKTQVEDAFSRYVSSNVAKEVLENIEEVELGGKHVTASVLFADIVGFTRMSENLLPKEVSNILNEYFSHISKIAQLQNGHIDKFMGDCAMVVFGVPGQSSNHAVDAIVCAVMIQKVVARLNEKRVRQNKLPVQFKIGVNTGLMVAGNLGSNDRMEYTVIGDPVNVASRLASIAGGNEILVTEEYFNTKSVHKHVVGNLYKLIQLKGKEEALSIYIVKGLENKCYEVMDKQINDIFSD